MTGAACLLAAAAAIAATLGSGPAVPGRAPEPPRARVDTAWVAAAGRTLHVGEGGDLQAALDAARPGDRVTLEAGAVYTGPFTLPRKEGDGWILIRTSAPDAQLPPPGQRIGPGWAAVMPRLQASDGAVISAAPGAHHYRFVGIEIGPVPGSFLHNVVLLGSFERSLEQLPHHIIVDRCYLHGDPVAGSRRGIALNGAHCAVIDSHLSDFKERGADSQAVAGWNGPGPFRIEGNYLEAAGENLMFGGADPAVPGLVPSDIEIRGNHFIKPLTWKAGHPGAEPTPWSVKNLLELKNARRVVIEGNVFARNWAHAQSGFAILFTVRNQDGSAPWSVVEDVLFANNIVTKTASGVSILGRDDSAPSGQARRIDIRNNLFTDVGGAEWGGSGTLFLILNGTADLTIEHNTALHTGAVIMAEGAAHTGFVYRANVTPHNQFGITGTGTGPGAATLKAYFPGAVVERNVMAGGAAALYPEGNLFPAAASRSAAGGAGADLQALCGALSPGDRPEEVCPPAASPTSRR